MIFYLAPPLGADDGPIRRCGGFFEHRIAQRGLKPSFAFVYLGIIDAGISLLHVAVLVEFPHFVAIGTVPLTLVIVPLIFEANGNSVIRVSPQLLF